MKRTTPGGQETDRSYTAGGGRWPTVTSGLALGRAQLPHLLRTRIDQI